MRITVTLDIDAADPAYPGNTAARAARIAATCARLARRVSHVAGVPAASVTYPAATGRTTRPVALDAAGPAAP